MNQMLIIILMGQSMSFCAQAAEENVPPVDPEAIEAWQDMRFGQFIHWGLYSKTAGYWDGRRAKSSGHIMLHERIPVEVWGNLAADFNPVKFNADEWVLASKNAGMKYFIITAKHHDGLAMYHSPSSDFDIGDKSPFKRDPLKELADACHKHGIKLGFYYSLGRDWEDPDVPTTWPVKGGRSNTWDYPDEDSKVFNRYFKRKVKPQITELLTQYGEVAIMWFDTPELISKEESSELRRLILSHQPKCIINDRIGNGFGDYKTREQKIGKVNVNEPWESCITMARHWNYDKDETGTYKSAELLVHQMVEIASKGGNYLLNIGPTAEGEYPEEARVRLQRIGEWMAVNGEGIYGTRAWTTASEDLGVGVDRKLGSLQVDENHKDADNDATSKVIPTEIRFTSKGKYLYGFISKNEQRSVLIKTLPRNNVPILEVSMLGYAGDLRWNQTNQGLLIEIPETVPMKGLPMNGFRFKRE